MEQFGAAQLSYHIVFGLKFICDIRVFYNKFIWCKIYLFCEKYIFNFHWGGNMGRTESVTNQYGNAIAYRQNKKCGERNEVCVWRSARYLRCTLQICTCLALYLFGIVITIRNWNFYHCYNIFLVASKQYNKEKLKLVCETHKRDILEICRHILYKMVALRCFKLHMNRYALEIQWWKIA